MPAQTTIWLTVSIRLAKCSFTYYKASILSLLYVGYGNLQALLGHISRQLLPSTLQVLLGYISPTRSRPHNTGSHCIYYGSIHLFECVPSYLEFVRGNFIMWRQLQNQLVCLFYYLNQLPTRLYDFNVSTFCCQLVEAWV